jgi:hypothetical protein
LNEKYDLIELKKELREREKKQKIKLLKKDGKVEITQLHKEPEKKEISSVRTPLNSSHPVVVSSVQEEKAGLVFFRPFENIFVSFLKRQGLDFVKRNGKFDFFFFIYLFSFFFLFFFFSFFYSC